MATATKKKPKIHSAIPSWNQGQIIELFLENIRPSDTNPRQFFDEAALQELADSIKIHGLLQPLLVRPVNGDLPMQDGYVLVSGERRLRASKLAGLDRVPCYVREFSDADALEAQIVENLQRLDVTPFEEARGLKVLRDGGQSAAAIAARIGKSPRYVWQSFGLLNLMENETAMKDLAAGTLNRSVALEIASLPSVALVNQAVKELRDWQGNYPPVVKVREMIDAGYRRELKGAVFSQADKKLLPDAGSCKDCPKRTGNNRELYPTGRADICTDIPCFDAKVKAHHKRALDVFREAGRTVITGKEAGEVIGHGGGLTYGAEKEWALPTDKCQKDPELRTWAELLEGLAEPIVLQNARFDQIEAFRLADVYPLLKEHHGIKPPKAKPANESKKSSSSGWESLDDKTETRVRAIRGHASLEALRLAKEKLAIWARGISDSNDLETVFEAFTVDHLDQERINDLAKRFFGLKGDEKFGGGSASERFVNYNLLLLSNMLMQWVNVWSKRDLAETAPQGFMLVNVLNLDWDGLVEQAEAELYPANEEAA
jgi:ParB/RepB/Spo0J family partition protein